jgi:hypothetical protein
MKKAIVLCLAVLVVAGLSLPVGSSAPVSAISLVDSAKCQENAAAPECPANCPDPASGKQAPDPSKCPAVRDCRSTTESCNVVSRYLNPLINALGILAGVAVTIGIATGGIQYAMSGGDPQKAAAGKKHIKMAVVAMIGFLLMYAFLDFLIPGGVLIK